MEKSTYIILILARFSQVEGSGSETGRANVYLLHRQLFVGRQFNILRYHHYELAYKMWIVAQAMVAIRE